MSKDTFTLKSDYLGGQATTQEVFNGFGCEGKNLSPPLYWENAPAGTQSFALTMYDPAAPTGSGWWHWVMFNIPATATELVQGAGDVEKGIAPEGSVQSVNDYGKKGYGGPCPPEGDGPHPYIITLHALKVDRLDVLADTNPAQAGFNINANTLAKASLVMYHSR